MLVPASFEDLSLAINAPVENPFDFVDY